MIGLIWDHSPCLFSLKHESQIQPFLLPMSFNVWSNCKDTLIKFLSSHCSGHDVWEGGVGRSSHNKNIGTVPRGIQNKLWHWETRLLYLAKLNGIGSQRKDEEKNRFFNRFWTKGSRPCCGGKLDRCPGRTYTPHTEPLVTDLSNTDS